MNVIQNRDYKLRELKKALSMNRFNKRLDDLTKSERYILEEIFKYENKWRTKNDN